MKESTENSLYHFKTKKEYFLELISEFKFTPRYNKEYILLNPNSERPVIDMVIPMVCWCDIPLNRISNHTERYGNFGIGIKKEWAISNLINPIFYVIENTVLAGMLNNISKALIDLGDIMESNKDLKLKLWEVTSNLYPSFEYLSQHVKPYNYQRIPSRQENRKFYDEKEWRYVPDPIGFENLILYPYLYETDEELQEAVEIANKQIKIRNLSFKPDDVTIIIIEEERYRDEVEEVICNFFNLNKFQNYELFSNKIKTIAQIKDGNFENE
jgi:hypothetical protein